MSGPSCLIDVLDVFAADGYTETFWPVADGLRCGACDHTTPAALIGFEALRRLEGASDPDDTVAVLAVVCPHCQARGSAVLRYGPGASAEDADVLAAITDRRPDEQPGVAP